jgi:hypothetical protein
VGGRVLQSNWRIGQDTSLWPILLSAQVTSTPATNINAPLRDRIEYLKRLAIGVADLQFSLSAITLLGEIEGAEKYNRVELRRFKAYETAFIMSDARAFTENRGGRDRKLSLRKIGTCLDGKQKRLHEKIIKLRNRIYAHSDTEFAMVRIDFMEMPLKSDPDFHLHHVQFDERLHFVKASEITETMEMISAITHALYCETRRVALEVRDDMPVVTNRSELY